MPCLEGYRQRGVVQPGHPDRRVLEAMAVGSRNHVHSRDRLGSLMEFEGSRPSGGREILREEVSCSTLAYIEPIIT